LEFMKTSPFEFGLFVGNECKTTSSFSCLAFTKGHTAMLVPGALQHAADDAFPSATGEVACGTARIGSDRVDRCVPSGWRNASSSR